MNPSNPLIVQSDRTILLEVDHPQHAEARDAVAQFAELEKSPEHIHTYRLSPLSLWNAAAGGMTAQTIIELLTSYSKYDIQRISSSKFENILVAMDGLSCFAMEMRSSLLLVTQRSLLRSCTINVRNRFCCAS